MKNKILSIVVLSIWVASVCHAGVFKWEDENGKVHFTDEVGEIPSQKLDQSEAWSFDPERGGSANKKNMKMPEENEPINSLTDRKKKECFRICKQRNFLDGVCEQKCDINLELKN